MKRKANPAASSKGPAHPLTLIFSFHYKRKCRPSPIWSVRTCPVETKFAAW